MKRDVRQHSFAPSDPIANPVGPKLFQAEVRAWAAHLDVAPAGVRLTQMTRKWASCSTGGRVTFATDLLSQSETFRREVIVHELLHLKVPNHGPLFRALLSAHLTGSWKALSSGTAGSHISGHRHMTAVTHIDHAGGR
jgi:predicted metal-dependent hydrolase